MRGDSRGLCGFTGEKHFRSQHAGMNSREISPLVGFKCQQRPHHRPCSLDEILCAGSLIRDQQRAELFHDGALGDETLDPLSPVIGERMHQDG